MKVIVIGGTGLIGSKLVAELRERGHDAVAASRASGVDVVTGAGLGAALSGAEVLVDVSNPRSFADGVAESFFEASTRHLLAAGREVGVQHHVVLSVVGTPRLVASGYFRGKLAQERLLQQSGLRYTLVQATQFFEFAPTIARFASLGEVVRLPPISVQPLAAAELASVLCSIVREAPLVGTLQVAGPEALPLEAFVRRSLEAANDPRKIVLDPQARYFGIPVQERTLLPEGEHRCVTTSFESWLSGVTRASS